MAIEKQRPMAWAVSKKFQHGIAGYYALMAVEKGMIGITEPMQGRP